MMEYRIENGVIKTDKGLPYLPRWFSEERVAFEVNKKGITQIDYWNKTTNGSYIVFLADFWGGIKFFLQDGDLSYAPDFAACEMLPCGFTAKWIHKGITITFSQYTVNDSVVTTVCADRQTKLRLRVQFYNNFCFSPGGSDVRYGGEERNWLGWEKTEEYFKNSFAEKKGETHVCMGASFPLEISVSMQHKRYTIESEYLGAKEQRLAISFDYTGKRAETRCKNTLENYLDLKSEMTGRYRKIAENAPVFNSPYPYLDKFMAMAPLFAESLRVKEYPGAVRSKTTYYWVWGWDGITSNYSTIYGGNLSLIKDQLDLYMIYSDEKQGIVHAYSRDMSIGSVSAIPAQGMYIALLHAYFANGGDIRPYYEFSKKIFGLICSKETAPYGFCEGTSLFPDFPADLRETGHDLSGFNNTIFYCAARAMEALADYMDDKHTREKAYDISLRIENNFKSVFFDEKAGYIVSSVDSQTLEKRPVFNSNAMKWENNFLQDLSEDIDERALEFFEKNIVTPMGLREIPAWCEAYDQDANQLHCWWPVTGEYFSRLINKFDRQDLTEQWVKWVTTWTKRITCPEGIDCLVQTEEPDFDDWNCLSGTWQAYSGRGWYQAAIHSVLGIVGDFGGLTVFPRTEDGVSVENLHWDNKTFDISFIGKGRYIDKITVNDIEIIGTNKIPCDILSEHNVIKIYKSEKDSLAVRIEYGHGFSVSEYSRRGDAVSFTASGYGHCKLRCKGKIFIDGTFAPDGIIDFTDKKQRKIEVRP